MVQSHYREEFSHCLEKIKQNKNIYYTMNAIVNFSDIHPDI